MARKSLHIAELQDHFREKDAFHVSEIIAFYRRLEKDLKRSTVDWRIYEMKKTGILQRVGRGWYAFEGEPAYQPEIDGQLKTLHSKTQKRFPYLQFCLWNTRWLNEFMIHQPGRFYILIETEKEAMESVFFFLKEHKKEVFLNPSGKILNQYVIDQKEVIIVTRLVSESPIQKVDTVPAAMLEKMLVDIYCDEVLFGAQQGTELENIFRNAFENYMVDEPKLLRYAARRSRKKEIAKFIKSFPKKRHNKVITAKS